MITRIVFVAPFDTIGILMKLAIMTASQALSFIINPKHALLCQTNRTQLNINVVDKKITVAVFSWMGNQAQAFVFRRFRENTDYV